MRQRQPRLPLKMHHVPSGISRAERKLPFPERVEVFQRRVREIGETAADETTAALLHWLGGAVVNYWEADGEGDTFGVAYENYGHIAYAANEERASNNTDVSFAGQRLKRALTAVLAAEAACFTAEYRKFGHWLELASYPEDEFEAAGTH